MTVTERHDVDHEAAVTAYAERLFATGLGALEAFTIGIGRRLGLYHHLTAPGGATPPEVAAAAGIDARYAREWLEQQANAGLIEVAAAADDPDQRRFRLTAAAQACLLDPEGLSSMGPVFDLVGVVSQVYDPVIDAFRTGRGVPYADYAIHDVQGDFNRPMLRSLLTTEWLPVVPGLVDRLAAPGAQVAEIGSGEGWAAIAIAQAWPQVRVTGYDNDEASVAAARRHAAERDLTDRVSFEVVDVTRPLPHTIPTGRCDLVLAVEMVHDLARPVEALATMRALAKPDGTILVIDERAAEAFDPASEDPVQRLLYAASVLCCLPVGTSEEPSAATGTVMRPSTLRRYARDAGLGTFEVLPIEHQLFRFYRLCT
jgi:2-polyprenyl-3-methyl-5-hydroxy-6-metoxy-1,4-benzoquinol methylase